MKKLGLILLFGLILITINANAAENNSVFTWTTSSNTSLNVQLTEPSICLDNTGEQDITIDLLGVPSGNAEKNADVNASIQFPNNTITDINFTNNSDGSYTYSDFNFSQTGTYKMDVNSVDSNGARGDRTYYLYVEDFNINISFLNNAATFTAESTGTIRNEVTNDDGNAFVDINGTTTINYPNNSTFLSNQSMTGLGTGEYIYAFTVPTTTGTYSVSSTFTCGSKSNTNTNGSFIVSETTTTTTTTTGTTTTTTTTGTSGARKLNGTILEIETQELKVGEPSKIFITIRNESPITTSFYLDVKINQGTLQEYDKIQLTQRIGVNEVKRIELIEAFTPTIAGSHIITAKLLAINKETEYDKLVKVFDIIGEIRYDVGLTCLQPFIVPGTEVEAEIYLKNLGNYYEDVFLSWWVEDEQGKTIGKSEFPLALYSNEETSLLRKVALPQNIAIGNYLFKAELAFRDEKRTGSCNFVIQKETDYYTNILEELTRKGNDLKKQIIELNSQGFNTTDLENKLDELVSVLGNLRQNIIEKDFDKATITISQAKTIIEEIQNMLRLFALSAGIPLELIAIISTIILIFGTGSILWKESSPESILGFSEEVDPTESILGFKG